MARKRTLSPLDPPAGDAVRQAAAALLDAVAAEVDARAPTGDDFEKAVKQLGRLRGRPLLLPALTAGRGRGARVRLADGSWKLDFIGAIGVYGFGHGDRDLLETAVVAAAGDAVFQGHLMPGPEYLRLSRALLRHSGKRLRHVWLSVSGAMANENALKMVLQHHHPADRLVAFEGNFCGRTLALSEITDRPAYREGLPLRGNVDLVPFYDPEDPHSTERSVEAFDAVLKRHPARVAGFLFELVQGEGGIRRAPREFFEALMERCRGAGIAVWVDEVQTFARTGELFAFQTLDLGEFVDLATVGKTLQGSAVLFHKAYNPRPGLVSGTYAGATVGMAVGARILERLEEEGYLGAEGRIAVLGTRVARRFESLSKRVPGAVSRVEGVGAMHAFVAFDGSPGAAKALLHAAFEEGLMLFTAGEEPTRMRMLLPVNTTDEELEAGFDMLEKALVRVAEERETPC